MWLIVWVNCKQIADSPLPKASFIREFVLPFICLKQTRTQYNDKETESLRINWPTVTETVVNRAGF